MDIKLTTVIDDVNPVENDLALDAPDGDVVWLGADGELSPEEVAQHIRCRLRMWRDEDPTAPGEGIPYLEELFEKGTSDSRIATILRRVILGTPGVSTLNSFALNRDNSTRTLNVTFEAVLDTGHVLNSDDFGPFVVEV